METRQTRHSVASSPNIKRAGKLNLKTSADKPAGIAKRGRPPKCKPPNGRDSAKRNNPRRSNGLASILTNGTGNCTTPSESDGTSEDELVRCDESSNGLDEDDSCSSIISVVGSVSSVNTRLRQKKGASSRNLNGRKSSQNDVCVKLHKDINNLMQNPSAISSPRRDQCNHNKQPDGRGRKRPLGSDDEMLDMKRRRSSAIAANFKITHTSPTGRKSNLISVVTNRPRYSPSEYVANQHARSQNQSSLRHKRSRSISSSCSRRSPMLNGGDYDSDGEEQTIRLRCPVEGCDSSGHLSGEHPSHFTQTTCPIYHNQTPQECEARHLSRQKGRRVDIEYVTNCTVSSRPSSPLLSNLKRATSATPTKTSDTTTSRKSLSQSPKAMKKSKSPTTKPSIKSEKPDCDNQSLLNKLVECRKREINQIILHNSTPQKRPEALRNPSREANIKNLTPIFDYEMFKEAQAKAAEQLQGKARDVKMRYGIKCIDLGRYEIDVWYGSPYPEEYRYLPKLYICEFCLKYMTSAAVSRRHVQKCSYRHPPGNEIYRKGNISFFEVDGQQDEIYCQNLCLLAKLFLDHKTLYFDVAPFLFYVMTEYDEDGFHIIGYFSKEKSSFLNYNVSCILTLPPYQKQGYGKLLIDLSYLITRLEGKVGSPEKPLSDMGLISYRSYWKLIILEYLCNYKAKEISIKDISQETGVNAYDIISTLQAMGMLKYWKGKHLILTRQDILDDYRVNKRKKNSFKRIDPSCLKWKPPCDNKS